MFDLYREQILDHSQNPRLRGHLAVATHQADGENRSCGDEIHIELRVSDGIIAEARHTGRSCAICAAAADMTLEQLQGKPVTEITRWDSKKITQLLGVPLSPIRLKCALLPIETIKQALKQA